MNTKDPNGFITAKERKESWLIIGILTFGISFWLTYEYFLERHSWINTFRLWKAVKRNQIKIGSKRTLKISPNLDEYILDVYGVKYNLWLYKDINDFSFFMISRPYTEYIGKPTYSPILKHYKHKIINKIKEIETNV